MSFSNYDSFIYNIECIYSYSFILLFNFAFQYFMSKFNNINKFPITLLIFL